MYADRRKSVWCSSAAIVSEIYVNKNLSSLKTLFDLCQISHC